MPLTTFYLRFKSNPFVEIFKYKWTWFAWKGLCKCNTVLFEWFLSETSFHIEARDNLEMAFLNDLVEMNYRILWCFFFFSIGLLKLVVTVCIRRDSSLFWGTNDFSGQRYVDILKAVWRRFFSNYPSHKFPASWLKWCNETTDFFSYQRNCYASCILKSLD